MKNIKALVVLLLFFLSSPYAFGENDLNITVKEKSQQTISIMVTNTSKETVTYVSVSVEKKESGKWLELRHDINCPCDSACSRVAAYVLHKDESTTAEWDCLDNSCTKSTSGKYRFIIYGYGVKKEDILGTSEPFEI